MCTLCTLGRGPADQRQQKNHTQYSCMFHSLANYWMQELETGVIKIKAEKSYQHMPLWKWTHLLANSMGPNAHVPAKYLRNKWARQLNFLHKAIAMIVGSFRATCLCVLRCINCSGDSSAGALPLHSSHPPHYKCQPEQVGTVSQRGETQWQRWSPRVRARSERGSLLPSTAPPLVNKIFSKLLLSL